jgi:hypothetical protein
MIEVEQILKSLNSTELGMKGTKERYAQCRQLTCLKEWHEDSDENHKLNFKFKKDGTLEEFNIYFKGQLRGSNKQENRENRIASTKRFINDINDLKPGDEILFERVINKDQSNITVNYFVSVNKYDSVVIFQNSQNNLEILNNDRFSEFIKIKGTKFEVNYLGEIMDCNVTINKNNCKFDLINQEGIKKEISSINTEYLLKFDYNKMLLNVYDPLLYCKIQFENI